MRCLFCSFDSPGYLFPLLGLALELRRRGHEVAFASGPAAQPALDAVAVPRIPREPEGHSFDVARWGVPLSTAVDVKHAEHAVGVFRPDLLVSHQLCQAALLVRERRALPLAVMGLFSYPWPVPRRPSTDSGERLQALRRWRLGDNLRTLNAARALFRMSPANEAGPEDPLLGDLFLLRTAPGLEPRLPDLPACVRPVGACLWEPSADDGERWEGLRARFALPDAPLVYVQPGRTFGGPSFWLALLQALDGRPVQVAASLGRMDAAPGALPANVYAAPHVPQGVVLPRARAAVFSPTTSVVLATLAHGVPGVVVPTGNETPDNAARLSELGCARVLAAEGLGAEALGQALAAILDDADVRAACARARAALGDPAGFAAAAGAVEALGRGSSAPAATFPARSSRQSPQPRMSHAVHLV
jgi:UDP:flavonoid glycosyltransferase YjiC (YdhE family)